jgi:hypothetical protein
MTGSTEGRSYQLAGTVLADPVPEASRPGLAYLGAVDSTVAITVLAGTVLAGTVLAGTVLAGAVSCRSRAACLAFGACPGLAMPPKTPPPEGLPPDESSSPTDTAAAAAAITLMVTATREARFPRFARAALTWPRNTATLRFAYGQLRMVTMP